MDSDTSLLESLIWDNLMILHESLKLIRYRLQALICFPRTI